MTDKDNFSNVQRRNSAVMAKYEWTSSLMGMKKTGEEVHDRRTKTHRKANEFLQGLLQKRSDGSLLDDNGTIDRYQKFLKYKSKFNDDDNLLNEFDRRLRALNNNNRRNQISKTNKELNTIGLQTTEEIENDIHQLNKIDRIKSLSKSTIISTLNTTNNSVVSNISSDEHQPNFFLNTDESQSSSLEQSSTSSINHPTIKTLVKPKVRRADGKEVPVNPIERRLRRASSDVLIFHHCHFPRSLKFREQMTTSIISEKQTPSPPPIEQYNNNELYHLLDQIENDCTSIDFTTMLNQLTLTTVQTDNNSLSVISENEVEIKENIPNIPNLFDQPSLSHEYYTTLNIDIENPKNISVYTMTISTVQLSPSLTVPYSILTGRRPLLQCSNQTNFKKIHSKRSKHTCQVTAIESLINIESLKENDIILKINNQSVWTLTTDVIRNILQEYSKQSKNCLLTIARLCQPNI